VCVASKQKIKAKTRKLRNLNTQTDNMWSRLTEGMLIRGRLLAAVTRQPTATGNRTTAGLIVRGYADQAEVKEENIKVKENERECCEHNADSKYDDTRNIA